VTNHIAVVDNPKLPLAIAADLSFAPTSSGPSLLYLIPVHVTVRLMDANLNIAEN